MTKVRRRASQPGNIKELKTAAVTAAVEDTPVAEVPDFIHRPTSDSAVSGGDDGRKAVEAGNAGDAGEGVRVDQDDDAEPPNVPATSAETTGVAKARVLKRKRPPVHPHDEIADCEAVLLEQTQSRPGSWVSDEYRQDLIKWLADKARQLPLEQSRPPLRQAERRRREKLERQRNWEREPFYVLLRARYFVAVVSRSAKELPLRKSETSEALIAEAADKFGMHSKGIEFDMKPGIASFYSAVNDKWKEWAASIREPQERVLWAHVRTYRAGARRALAQPVPKITIHRTQCSVERATERAAKVAMRMIKGAVAGVDWPDAQIGKLFADFSENTLREHFQKHFATNRLQK